MVSKLYFNILSVVCFLHFLHKAQCVDQNKHVLKDQPLILTPYLESGNAEEAQKKSRVSPDINGVRSYTGFFTVDKACGNNLFFWFVPAEVNWEKATVLLWLTGGPGTSSLVGLFTEVGPFMYVNESKTLVENKSRWTKDFNVIFLDQPVGTGFSFTNKECYMKNIGDVAREVYSAVEQFFILFPNLRKNNFFLVGDSYAGTYQPAVGVEIHRKNLQSKEKINLKGVLLGNPYMDLKCHNYASYWYETGIVEQECRDRIIEYQNARNNYIKKKDSSKANEYEDKIWSVLGGTLLPSIYNLLYNQDITLDFKYFVNSSKIREQIKVGNTKYNVTSYFGTVGSLLSHELIVPATQNVKTLLDEKYFVGFYTGQVDLQCSYSTLACVLSELNHVEYQKAERRGWFVKDRLAGWVRHGGNLFTAVVRDAGHLVPMDQGEAALALVKGVLGSYPATTLKVAEEKTTCKGQSNASSHGTG